MTLRERLLALADADAVCDDDKPYTRALALAAARLALEDAEKVCEAQSFDVGANGDPRDVFHDHACGDCATACRALRDGLGYVISKLV